MLDNYLNILKESLEKKLLVLEHIREVNQAQTDIIKKEPPELEAFDKCVDEKDLYINELAELDEGFEALYDNIKQELLGKKAEYAPQIGELQRLISEITDQSVAIQAQEERNKSLVEACFKKERQSLGQVRKSSKAAYGYYSSMSQNKGPGDSRFMDTKK